MQYVLVILCSYCAVIISNIQMFGFFFKTEKSFIHFTDMHCIYFFITSANKMGKGEFVSPVYFLFVFYLY